MTAPFGISPTLSMTGGSRDGGLSRSIGGPTSLKSTGIQIISQHTLEQQLTRNQRWHIVESHYRY